MKRIFTCILFLSTLPFLNAQIYKGTIGKYPVFLQIEYMDETGEIYGNYFYESNVVNIPFEGKMHGNKLTAWAGSRFADKSEQEQFQLLKTGGRLVGSWKYQGKKLDVAFTEYSPETLENKYMTNPFFAGRVPDNFEYIRTSLARFVAMDSTTSVKGGITLSWYKETHWDSQLFRVTKGLPDSTMRWVNNKLELLQLMDFSGYGTCGFGYEEVEYHANLRDYFINGDFLSIDLVNDYYCGGAHPDFSSYQLNLDLKRHRELKTEDLLQFDGYVIHQEDNFDDWSDYRSTVFAEKVNEYLKAAYPEYFQAKEESDDDCMYDDPTIWAYTEVLITPHGFKVGAYFARYMRYCDDPDWSYIPFKTVEHYLNPVYKNALLKIK